MSSETIKFEELFQEQEYSDYKWLDPQKIVVSQRVRMKCQFGFPIEVLADYKQTMKRYAFLMID